MRISDVDPYLLHGVGAVLGITLGTISGSIAGALPRRYGITDVLTGRRKRTRDLALVGLLAGCSVGIVHVLASVPDMSLSQAAFLLGLHSVVAAIVLTAGAIDLEHMILPNELTVGGTLLCLLTSPLRSVGLGSALGGAALGLVLAYLPSLLYRRLRSRSGIGIGDVKLAALAGAWHGATGAIFVLFAGALQAVLAALVLRLLGRRDVRIPRSASDHVTALEERARAGDEGAASELAEDPVANAPLPGVLGMTLPLGPFLALACIELLFVRRWLTDQVLAWLGR